MKLYKKTYTVYSQEPLHNKTIVQVAEECDSGDMFCSDAKTEIVDQDQIPDEVIDFFENNDVDDEEEDDARP